jgi:hypothetical protein
MRAGYVEFALVPDHPGEAPLMRDVWAGVRQPDGRIADYPAFYDKDSTWKIRVRPELAGTYEIVRADERDDDGATRALKATFAGPRKIVVTPDVVEKMKHPRQISINPGHPRRFEFPDGSVYYPIGINLGWAPFEGPDSFKNSFRQMRAAGLNWTRIWMCHWSGTNLDWLPEWMGANPPPGQIDARVAENWDRIIADAERNGIHFQLVLQHHGQYSTASDADWARNPWNIANGGHGFLKSPGDFFSSEKARRITKAKYRYIVARHGHSPAILAWELFNEAHLTDARFDDALLGRWHDEMGAWLRRCDPWKHIVTTSHNILQSAVYAHMDFYQPHLYAVNMLANTRRFPFAPPAATRDRPLFHGEIGHNNIIMTGAEKKAGAGLIPPIWTSLMAGDETMPGQTWYWEQILNTPRMGEMRAISTFIEAARLSENNTAPAAFSPRVECDATVPRIITAGHAWAPHPRATIQIPDDGRDDPALADIPACLVADPAFRAAGFVNDTEIKFTKTNAQPIGISLDDLGPEGGSMRIKLDGAVVHEMQWPPRPAAQTPPGRGPPSALPRHITLNVPEGAHSLVVENTGTPPRSGSVVIGSFNLAGDMPALAACGRRGAGTVVLYFWHRENIYKIAPGTSANGQALIDNLPAGDWKITWWNMECGGPGSQAAVTHRGGTLRLPTPPITRHAAVLLEKEPH